MNSMIIADASALLALINKEPGHEQVQRHVGSLVMSAVNLSECAVVLHDIGVPEKQIPLLLNPLLHEVVDFTHQQAYVAARLRKKSKAFGLSFGDRACIALGIERGYPILTADKAWAKLKVAATIQLVR